MSGQTELLWTLTKAVTIGVVVVASWPQGGSPPNPPAQTPSAAGVPACLRCRSQLRSASRPRRQPGLRT